MEITHDGTTYRLVESLNGYCAMEAQTGRMAGSVLMDAAAGSLTATRALLWAYLHKHHAEAFPTIEDVGVLVDGIGLAELHRHMDLIHGGTPAAPEKPVRRRKRAHG